MEEKITLKTKLGTLEINKNEIINFLEPPLGYVKNKKYALIEDKDSIFLWLQSIDDHNLAFPVLEVELLGYQNEDFLTNDVINKLGDNGNSKLNVYTIVSIPENPENMTANFKGPVIINKNLKLAVQTILSNNKLEVAKPIFNYLQSRLVKPVSNECESKECKELNL